MIHTSSWAGRKVTACMKEYCGTPTIFINDKPIHSGGILARPSYDRHSFSDSDPDIITPYLFFFVGKNTEADIADTTARFHALFEEHPNALGNLVINVVESEEWRNAHLEEMTLYDPGTDHEIQGVDPSWASEVWRTDSAEFVYRLVSHLHQTFTGRIFQYQIGSGACGENGPITDAGSTVGGVWNCGDFSKPMLRKFRAKLRGWYADDVDALRRAWSMPEVTFENALPPDRIERMRTEWFALRSPHNAQTADYYRTWAECIEENAILWCEAVKRATNGEAITATPMGAILDYGINGHTVHHMMKSSVSQVLASPHVDMFESPVSYILRDMGKGDTSAMIPLGMLKLAGKMWFRDFDSCTSLVKSEHGAVYSPTPENGAGDVEMLKRDAGYSFLKGGGFWWHEIANRMYSLPEHQEVARRMFMLGRGMIHADRSTMPGLGVFVDAESNRHLADSNRLIYPLTYESRRLHWTHCGMASETYLLDDIAHPNLPGHKVIMIPNALCISDAQVQAIKNYAGQHHAAVIWIYAPGVHTPEGFDIERVSRITGFPIKTVDVEAMPRISMLPGDHPWSKPPLSEGGTLSAFGASLYDFDDACARGVGPLFYADVQDGDGIYVLGDLNALNKPGLVMREMDGYTSIYCAAPFVHEALLRVIGRDSGAHIYLESDDVIHVSGNLAVVNAKRAGEKQIKWHEKAEVVLDLYAGKEIARDTEAWTVNLQRHETGLYFAGPAATAEKVLNDSNKAASAW